MLKLDITLHSSLFACRSRRLTRVVKLQHLPSARRNLSWYNGFADSRADNVACERISSLVLEIGLGASERAETS
jgi:hypothetical protein